MLTHVLSGYAPEAVAWTSLAFALSALLALWRNHGVSLIKSHTPNPLATIYKHVKAWSFLLNGPAIIQEGYDKAKGAPYEIFTPENRYVFVSSAKHVKEIDAAPDAVLSLQAAAKQLLQPQYTMHKFNWFDKRGVDGTPLVKTLRTLLTNNVPQLLPDIRLAVSGLFDEALESQPVTNGAKTSPLYQMMLNAVSYTNALAIFGPELAKNKIFLKSAVDFIENTLLIAEVVRLLPSHVAPIVGKLLAKRFRSHDDMWNALVPVTEQRLRERDQQKLGHAVPAHKDCIQWVMETSPRQNSWSAGRIVHELMALWFGSVHIVSTTICFAMQDLCLHPEYLDPLRKELESGQYAIFEKTGKGLPLMDSFIKESMRTTPTESMSSRRLALSPFELSDGSRVEPGEWICTPLRAMNRDSTKFSRPNEFHGFRFVDPRLLEAISSPKVKGLQAETPSALTDVTLNFQIWGIGRIACPGRFYAAAVMKTIIASIITKYDVELENPAASRWFTWRSFIYPLSGTKVAFRPRELEAA